MARSIAMYLLVEVEDEVTAWDAAVSHYESQGRGDMEENAYMPEGRGLDLPHALLEATLAWLADTDLRLMKTEVHDVTEKEEGGFLSPAQQIALARLAQVHLSRRWLVNEFGEQHPVILDALQQFIENREQARDIAWEVQAAEPPKQRLIQRAFQALLTTAADYRVRKQTWDVVRRDEVQSRPAWRQHASYNAPQEQARRAWLAALHRFHQAWQEFISAGHTVGLEALSVLLGSLSPVYQQFEPNAPRLDTTEAEWVLSELLDIAEVEELNTSSDEEDHLARLKAVMERGRKLLAQVKEQKGVF